MVIIFIINPYPPKILLRPNSKHKLENEKKNEKNVVILHFVIMYKVAEARRLVMLLRRFFPLLSNCQADLRKARKSIKSKILERVVQLLPWLVLLLTACILFPLPSTNPPPVSPHAVYRYVAVIARSTRIH